MTRKDAFDDAVELHVGDTLQTTIEKAVYRGRGLGRVGGRVVFVPRTYAGDRVKARVREVRSGWAEAALESVLEPAATRRDSPCEYVPRCGGCVYQDLGYEAQLAAKESILRESLARAGAPWEGEIPVSPSPETGWRMRANLHFFQGKDGLRLGLKQEGTRRVVDIERCLQLSDGMNGALRSLRAALGDHRGLSSRLRGVEILESPDGQVRVISLATALGRHEARRLAFLEREVPGLDGLGVDVGRGHHQWLSGSPHVEAPVLGLSMRVHVRSFFQANRFLYESLARTVVDLLPGRGRALDLYAGVGLFALPLAARDGGEVVAGGAGSLGGGGRPGQRQAQRARRRPCDSPGRSRGAGLHPGPSPESASCWDPPRTGVEQEIVDLVAARRPEAIVYVSCDPPTLGRDLARFASLGFRPDTVRIFDLFPDTFHLETVVRLRPGV